MAENKGESEYSLQYFGFTPEDFAEQFSEIVLEEMSTAVKNSLIDIPSFDGFSETKEKLQQHFVKLHDKWCDHAKSVLTKAEPVIKGCFTIPKNVLFETDCVFKETYTEERVEALEKEVAALEITYAEQLKEYSLLEAAFAKVDSLEPYIIKADEASMLLEPIVKTIKEIEELENCYSVYVESRSQLFVNKDEDEDSEEEGRMKYADVLKCKEIL